MTAADVTPLSPPCQVPEQIARMKGEPTVLAALAAGATIEAAAQAGAVAERTVYRRMDDPAYRAEIARQRQTAIDRALGRLASASASAVDVLVELAASAESETVRLKAADRAIAHVIALHDHVAVLDRLEELEAQLATITRERTRTPRTPSTPWRMHAS